MSVFNINNPPAPNKMVAIEGQCGYGYLSCNISLRWPVGIMTLSHREFLKILLFGIIWFDKRRAFICEAHNIYDTIHFFCPVLISCFLCLLNLIKLRWSSVQVQSGRLMLIHSDISLWKSCVRFQLANRANVVKCNICRCQLSLIIKLQGPSSSTQRFQCPSTLSPVLITFSSSSHHCHQ